MTANPSTENSLAIDDPIWQTIISLAKPITLPPETIIFRQGDSCKNYILVKSGRVKVFTRAENGREILLYRVEQGESCTLTTSCLLADNNYPAEGVAETEVQALVISVDAFNNALNQSATFRQFVFDAYGRRIRDIITLVEEVSFGRLDLRLAKLLSQREVEQNKLIITHQALATELGTAREVVSRQLKEFERHGWLKLSRGEIEILSPEALKKLTLSL